MVARYFALRCAPAECVPASQGAAETYGCVTTEPGGGETTVAGALELEGGVTTVVFGGGWTLTQPARPSRASGMISLISGMWDLHGNFS
jgi:hypothetical protein